MPLTQNIIDAAPDVVAGVVREWSRLAPADWQARREPIDSNGLEGLVRRLCEAALTRDARPGRPTRELIRAAIQHGRERRRIGFSEEMLVREYHLLRRACWNVLSKKGWQQASETLMRIDNEISLATSACLRGFHRSEDIIGDELLVEEVARNWGR